MACLCCSAAVRSRSSSGPMPGLCTTPPRCLGCRSSCALSSLRRRAASAPARVNTAPSTPSSWASSASSSSAGYIWARPADCAAFCAACRPSMNFVVRLLFIMQGLMLRDRDIVQNIMRSSVNLFSHLPGREGGCGNKNASGIARRVFDVKEGKVNLSRITYLPFTGSTVGMGAIGSWTVVCCCCCWQETKAAAVRARIAIFFIIILLVLMLFAACIRQG